MSDHHTYNGWTNYPTWCVNLWLSNDESLYNETRGIVSDEIKENPGDMQRVAVADALKDYVRNVLAPDLGASFAADLLGYALDEIEWFEIADAWLEDAEPADRPAIRVASD